MSSFAPAYGNNLELDLKFDLWRRGNYEYFLPKGGFPKQEYCWKQLKNPDIYEILYGGGAGGSKTWTGATFFGMEGLTTEGMRMFAGRNTITNVEKSVLVTLKKVMKKYRIPDEYWKYNAQKHYFEFPKTDSVIEFLDLQYAPSDPYYDDYGSLEYAAGWIEEAQQTHFNAYDTLSTRVGRQYELFYKDLAGKLIMSNGKPLVVKKLLLTANPKKNWLMRAFYMPNKEGVLPKTSLFLPVLAKENPLTPQSYLDTLDAIKDPVKKARLRDGIWEYEDAIYALFTYDKLAAMFNNTLLPTIDSRAVITVDPARKGKDRCIILVWLGLTVVAVWIADKCDVSQIVEQIKTLQSRYNVANESVVVDENGVGGGVADYIKGCYEYLGNSDALVAKDEVSPFKDLRVQCFWKASEMVSNGKVGFARNFEVGTFGITTYQEHYTRTNIVNMIREELEVIEKTSEDDDKKIKITRKDAMRNTLARSPDFADAFSERFVLLADLRKLTPKEYAVGIIPYRGYDEQILFNNLMREYNYATAQ